MSVNVITPTLLERIQSGEIPDSEIASHLVVDMYRFKAKHQDLLTRVSNKEPGAMSDLLALVCDVPREVIDELPMIDFVPMSLEVADAIQAAVGRGRTGKN